MTALIAALKTRLATNAVLRYTIRGPLRSDWRVLGTGKEQITCIAADSPNDVRKILIAAIGRDADELQPVAECSADEFGLLSDVLGSLCVPTTYSVERIDRFGTLFAVVGRQPRVTILDSLFHNDGVLSPSAKAMPLHARRQIADAVKALRIKTGYLVDVIGIGNFVFVDGSDMPVLIDTIPLHSDSAPGWMEQETYRRLDQFVAYAS